MWLGSTFIGHSDLSCSEEDDLELCPSYSDTTDIKLNLETHETLNRNGQRKNSPEYAYGGTWFQVYKTLKFHRVHYPQRVSRDDL